MALLATAVLMVAVAATPNGSNAAPIPQVFVITSIQGTIQPFTYTDADGTFTISAITVTQNPSTHSTVTFDLGTGSISDVLVLNVAFNNGKPGPLNANLSGTVMMVESGTLLPPDDPFCQQFEGGAPDGCANLNIQSGTLTGAGPFNNTKIKGKNPTVTVVPVDRAAAVCIIWHFSPPDSPPYILLDLPSPPFINGSNLVIHGDFTACLAPVGGTTELRVHDGSASANASATGGSGPSMPYAPIAIGLAAALFAASAGGWYVRRRWLVRP